MEKASLEKLESKVEQLMLQEIHKKQSYLEGSGYRLMCKLAAEHEDVFKLFKRNKYYRKVLEHTTREQGQDYVNIIEKIGGDLLKYFPKFQENDKFGSPIVFPYSVGNFSPTTLRYVKVLADLKNFFTSLKDLAVVEIGGGYGGQCKIISDVYAVSAYAIIDLDVVVPLIKRYLAALNVECYCVLTQSQVNNSKRYDLVISNYAFSELPKNLQRQYTDEILAHAQRGYITCNFDGLTTATSPYNRKEIINLLSKHHAVSVISEGSKSRPHSINFIVAWDDTRPDDLANTVAWYVENRKRLGF